MISRTLLNGHFGEDGEDNPSLQGGWHLAGGAGESLSIQRLTALSGKMGKIGSIIPTYARECISTGFGVLENLLTRRSRISSLSSLSSLKQAQTIEIDAKCQRGTAQSIFPIGEVIFPIFPASGVGNAGCGVVVKAGHNILGKAA